MATKDELELRVKELEKALGEAVDAIRSLAQTTNQAVDTISKLNNELTVVKSEHEQTKVVVKKLITGTKTANISTYK